MTRTLLLALLALGLTAAASAQSQTDPTPPADTTAADSTEAPELDPERARALYDEGLALKEAGDNEAALAKLDESLVYNPASSATQLRRGQVLTSLNRLEEARDAFALAVELGDGPNAAAAERALEQIQAALDARAAAAAQAEASAATTGKVNEAVGILQGINITDTEADVFGPAAEGFALLEQAREAGYDADLAADYYAVALIGMNRGAEAVPYAQTAIDNADPAADNSRLYLLLGRAQMAAGDKDSARAAFEAVEEGQSWHGWAVHFLRLVDAEG